MIRIEKTFLIKDLPKDYSAKKHSKIEQCYLIDSSDACRIRKKDGSYSVTRKLLVVPGDLSMRDYYDLPISAKEFEAIWDFAKSKLTKNRYYYETTFNYELRIDEFEGSLKGLYLAELVIFDETQKDSFIPSEWLGQEVTACDWVYNQFLSQKKFSEIDDLIKDFESSTR